MQWALTILSCRPMTAELLIRIPVVTPPAGGRAHFLKLCSLTEAKLWFTICCIPTSHSWMCSKTTFLWCWLSKQWADTMPSENTCVIPVFLSWRESWIRNKLLGSNFLEFGLRTGAWSRSLAISNTSTAGRSRCLNKTSTQKSVISQSYFWFFFFYMVKICANHIQYVDVKWGNLFPKCGSQSPGGAMRYCRWEIRSNKYMDLSTLSINSIFSF